MSRFVALEAAVQPPPPFSKVAHVPGFELETGGGTEADNFAAWDFGGTGA